MTLRDVNNTQKSNFDIVTLGDSAQLDAFGRLRSSSPNFVFDAQLTYGLQPLLYEQVTTGTGGAVTYDGVNGYAALSLTASSAFASAFLQSFEYFRYQPGRSQNILMTGVFGGNTAAPGVTKFQGYSDGTNGVEFQVTSSGPQFALLSSTALGNQIVGQASWNLDKLDGTGSGMILDLTKTHILVIDFQALYAGRVRVGFDINGQIFYAHEFNNANNSLYPYIRTANLPVRAGLSCTSSATDTMYHLCASVISEGGQSDLLGYEFSASGSVIAASGAMTHILSVQPSLLHNSFVNRTKFVLDDFEILNTGTVPVQWYLCLGATLTGTTAFTPANTTYSAFAYNTAGALSGSPLIVLASSFTPSAGSGSHYSSSTTGAPTIREPITLDHAGNVRALGTISLLVSGIGGTAQCNATMNWHEIR